MKRLWLLYLVLIFGLSSIPGTPDVSRSPIALDKPAHFLLYAGLTFVYVRAGNSAAKGPIALLGIALLIAGATGLADELYQSLIPNRTPELGDWIADLSGGLCGALVAMWRRRTPNPRDGRPRP